MDIILHKWNYVTLHYLNSIVTLVELHYVARITVHYWNYIMLVDIFCITLPEICHIDRITLS